MQDDDRDNVEEIDLTLYTLEPAPAFLSREVSRLSVKQGCRGAKRYVSMYIALPHDLK